MQIGETLDDRFTCALHLQRERAEVSPVRRVSALRRHRGGRPCGGVLDNCRERDRDRQHIEELCVSVSSVVSSLPASPIVPAERITAQAVCSGACDMNPKGMSITMKKIVSAVEQFLQSGANWRW